MDNKYVEYAVEKTLSLLSIDSPTGYTDEVASVVMNEFESAWHAASEDMAKAAQGGAQGPQGPQNPQEPQGPQGPQDGPQPDFSENN